MEESGSRGSRGVSGASIGSSLSLHNASMKSLIQHGLWLKWRRAGCPSKNFPASFFRLFFSSASLVYPVCVLTCFLLGFFCGLGGDSCMGSNSTFFTLKSLGCRYFHIVYN